MTADLSFQLLVLLLVAADLSFWSPLVITNSGSEYYVRFNLQKIWSMCFQHLLPPEVLEHTPPLL
jgi:hypothetical protein